MGLGVDRYRDVGIRAEGMHASFRFLDPQRGQWMNVDITSSSPVHTNHVDITRGAPSVAV